jgi:D-glycero-alpha-D-manno-heptose-7-phosphate kinase
MEMFQYPHASVSQLGISNELWWELERRMVLVFLGRTHSSSEVHSEVISRLDRANADKSALEPLRRAAYQGKNALFAGDFAAFGKCMIENTEAQSMLHAELVPDSAREVMALAKQHGALGWKVNGAGGDGGSLSILFGPEGERKRAFIHELPTLNPAFQVIPTYLSRTGLRRWEAKV